MMRNSSGLLTSYQRRLQQFGPGPLPNTPLEYREECEDACSHNTNPHDMLGVCDIEKEEKADEHQREKNKEHWRRKTAETPHSSN